MRVPPSHASSFPRILIICSHVYFHHYSFPNFQCLSFFMTPQVPGVRKHMVSVRRLNKWIHTHLLTHTHLLAYTMSSIITIHGNIANYWLGKPELKTKLDSVLAPPTNSVKKVLTVILALTEGQVLCNNATRLWEGYHYFHFTDENIKAQRGILLDCSSLFPTTRSCLDNKHWSFRLQLRSHFLQEAFLPWSSPIQWAPLLRCPAVCVLLSLWWLVLRHCVVTHFVSGCLHHQTLTSSRAEGKGCILNKLKSYHHPKCSRKPVNI